MTKIQMEKLLKHYLRTQIEPEIIRVASEMFRSGTLDTSSIPKDDQTVIKALTYISLDRAKALTHPLGPEGQAMVRDLEFAGQVGNCLTKRNKGFFWHYKASHLQNNGNKTAPRRLSGVGASFCAQSHKISKCSMR
jgi:hypothetical protein